MTYVLTIGRIQVLLWENQYMTAKAKVCEVEAASSDSIGQQRVTSKSAKILARNLPGILKQKGFSQSSFAKACEVSQSTISLIIAGKQSPTLGLLDKMAEILGFEDSAALISPDLKPDTHIVMTEDDAWEFLTRKRQERLQQRGKGKSEEE